MEKIRIGKIVNTRGLKGEVKVLNCSDFVKERYKKNKEVYVISEDNSIDTKLTINSFKESERFIYVTFKEVNTIEEALVYKNCDLLIDISELSKIDDDTFYHYQLLDMEVYYNNKVIGKIVEITDNGVQDLIRIENNNKSFLAPFLDEFIEKIDLENKCIYLKNLEGLI